MENVIHLKFSWSGFVNSYRREQAINFSGAGQQTWESWSMKLRDLFPRCKESSNFFAGDILHIVSDSVEQSPVRWLWCHLCHGWCTPGFQLHRTMLVSQRVIALSLISTISMPTNHPMFGDSFFFPWRSLWEDWFWNRLMKRRTGKFCRLNHDSLSFLALNR
jgi:hypothetical protein